MSKDCSRNGLRLYFTLAQFFKSHLIFLLCCFPIVFGCLLCFLHAALQTGQKNFSKFKEDKVEACPLDYSLLGHPLDYCGAFLSIPDCILLCSSSWTAIARGFSLSNRPCPSFLSPGFKMGIAQRPMISPAPTATLSAGPPGSFSSTRCIAPQPRK
jgi:hypothetical protein